MLDFAFRYDLDRETWVQCTETALVEENIEELDSILLVDYIGYENDGLYARCPVHGRDELVTSRDKGEIVTEDGCKFSGLVGVIEKKFRRWTSDDKYDIDKRYKYVPFRWRVYQRNDNSPINIAADVMHVDILFSNSSVNWKNFSFSIDVAKKKMVVSKIRYWDEKLPLSTYAKDLKLSMKEWTEVSGVDIPDNVSDVAMNSLREGIKIKYSIKPSALSQIKGKFKIMAFVIRPFDLNIVFLKKFLRDFITDEKRNDIFDKVFPYEQKDNYRKFCKMLEIKPPKSLRKAYTFNPYSIIWYMIFRQWGIEDINLIQKFLYLDRNICSISLRDLCYERTNNKVVCLADDFAEKWEAVELYCQWLMDRNKIKRMLNWLYDVSTGNALSDMQWDILRSFHDYFNNLSDEVKDRLLRDGLTKYVHDAIGAEITSFSQNLSHHKIYYSDEILKYECRINQYEFRLVRNTAILPKLGAAFNNCVASYRQRVLSHETIIMYLTEGNEYLACIEINRNHRIVQALGKYNKKLYDQVGRLVSFWADMNNLNVTKIDLGKINKANVAKEFENAVIEQLPYNKTIEEMNLKELLAMDEADIEEGYYLWLQERLDEDTEPKKLEAGQGNFTDEISELMQINPQGRRIYEAALAGNTEAMRALGFMYARGKALQQDNDKALHWFMKAVEQNDESAELEAKRLSLEMGKVGTAEDKKFLEFLSSMTEGYEREILMDAFLRRLPKVSDEILK